MLILIAAGLQIRPNKNKSPNRVLVHRDLSLGTQRVTLGLSKNPDALSIRIYNPIKAHCKC